jgi:hypothetical protein
VKKNLKKLRLSKETVSALTSERLGEVVGAYTQVTCFATCLVLPGSGCGC